MTPETQNVPEDEAGFDRQMRTAFNAAMPVAEIPPSLFRKERRRTLRSVFLVCAGLLIGAIAGTAILFRPPPLVQAAISHERNERTLRGIFMPSQAPIARYFGLAPTEHPPGLLQMAKPCQISDHLAYHLTTWLDGVEGGGMVTAITFAQPVDLPERSGWWPDAFWRVVQTSRGTHVLLIAQNRKAIEAAAKHFH